MSTINTVSGYCGPLAGSSGSSNNTFSDVHSEIFYGDDENSNFSNSTDSSFTTDSMVERNRAVLSSDLLCLAYRHLIAEDERYKCTSSNLCVSLALISHIERTINIRDYEDGVRFVPSTNESNPQEGQDEVLEWYRDIENADQVNVDPNVPSDQYQFIWMDESDATLVPPVFSDVSSLTTLSDSDASIDSFYGTDATLVASGTDSCSSLSSLSDSDSDMERALEFILATQDYQVAQDLDLLSDMSTDSEYFLDSDTPINSDESSYVPSE